MGINGDWRDRCAEIDRDPNGKGRSTATILVSGKQARNFQFGKTLGGFAVYGGCTKPFAKKRNITPGNAILLKINDEPIGRRMPINSIESMFDEDEKEFSIQFRRAASINHMFTSPAVATTLGLTDVLQHMFENEDVDINEHHRVLDKHLLPRIFSATLLYSSLLSSHNPSFDYLLLRGDIDLSVDWCTRQSNDRNILHVIASGYRQQPGSVSSSTSKGTSPSEFERR
mmetsp:Transcript_24047/g.51923  ORF Transcript_24047/g.51923 Transcript_24047/m.51923 type:complete len:228 (-) Transcript_24047:459-1142(-)